MIASPIILSRIDGLMTCETAWVSTTLEGKWRCCLKH